MRNYFVFLKKELIESLKTYKLIIMGAVFLFFGMAAPLTAKFLPEILKWAISTDPSTAGLDLSGLITDPYAVDAWTQFFVSYIGQIGLFVLVIVFSGTLSSEFSRGTLTIMLSKGLSRAAVIMSKLTSAFIIWTLSYVAAALTAWGYTAYMFPGESVTHLLFALFTTWVFGLFLLALTVLMATLTKKGFACMLSVGAAVIVLMLLNMVPQIAKYNPFSLAELPVHLVMGTSTLADTVPALVFSAISTIACVALAIVIFSKRKKMMLGKLVAIMGAAALGMVLAVLISK